MLSEKKSALENTAKYLSRQIKGTFLLLLHYASECYDVMIIMAPDYNTPQCKINKQTNKQAKGSCLRFLHSSSVLVCVSIKNILAQN